jgi:serine protease Do
MMSMNRKFRLATRQAGLLGVVGVSCIAALSAAAKDLPKVSVSDREVDRSAKGASYANVIKRVTPSVVTIESRRTIRLPSNHSQFFNDPRFRQFFGGGDDSQESSRKMRQEGLGSGVIVSDDGYILTNNHVVEGADEDGVKVSLSDGKTKYEAKVVGKDPRTDIAILKIEAPKKLPALTLADSDKLEVGDVVLAVGNPFGIGQSVSSGIISALSRGFGILGQQGYEDFIQTDASINQGNSGGALVDAEGRLIGINQSIASPSGANAGVGFAIPINLARSVMERLIVDGKIVRGFLGVQLQAVTPDLAESFKLPDASGALVGEVQPGTPAAKAGMAAGDVLIEFNNKRVSDSAHLRLMVSQTPPKTPVSFKVLRDGKEKNFNLTLAELPDDVATNAGGEQTDRTAEAKPDMLDGVEITDLTGQARRRFDVPQRVTGALVTKVDEDSNAAEAGLRPGDVIVEINRRPVKDADEAVEMAGNAKGDRILVRIYSRSGGAGGTRYLSVQSSSKKK